MSLTLSRCALVELRKRRGKYRLASAAPGNAPSGGEGVVAGANPNPNPDPNPLNPDPNPNPNLNPHASPYPYP